MTKDMRKWFVSVVNQCYGDFGQGERPAEDRVGRVLSGLGPRVRRAQGAGVTLEGLAAVAGTSAAHLSRLESGERRPSLDGALRLALALGVPFSELFEEPGPGTVVRGGEAPSTKARDSVRSNWRRRVSRR